jgi:sec-independent protein translocase protein TatA
MPNVGPTELIVVVVIALLVLGPKKLPAAGRSLGGSLREFKNGITGHGAPAVEAAGGGEAAAEPREAES